MSADVASVLGAVADETDRLLGSLEDLAQRAGPLLAARRGQPPPTVAGLSVLDDYLVAALAADAAATGIGIVLGPGTLADRERWIHWFWRPPGRPAERLRVNLDPVSCDGYDYTMTEWYRRGREAGTASLTGPYVDYVCSNEYVVTLTVPIGEGADFVGLAGLDVRVAHLEELLLPGMLGLGATVVVVTAEGRVVSSSSALFPPGTTVAGRDLAVTSLRERTEANRPNLPWRVLVGCDAAAADDDQPVPTGPGGRATGPRGGVLGRRSVGTGTRSSG